MRARELFDRTDRAGSHLVQELLGIGEMITHHCAAELAVSAADDLQHRFVEMNGVFWCALQRGGLPAEFKQEACDGRQQQGQQGILAGLRQDLMEQQVGLDELFQASGVLVHLRQAGLHLFNSAFQFLYVFIRGPLSGVAGNFNFEHLSNLEQVVKGVPMPPHEQADGLLDSLRLDLGNVCTAAGQDLDQPSLLKLLGGLADHCPAHSKLLT